MDYPCTSHSRIIIGSSFANRTVSYYLLYGDNIQSFPDNFGMIAGDSGQRNFTWPIPDPPKSDWSGNQLSQFALQQKAIGFNCLNYKAPPEPSLYRHYLPDKDYMDERCEDGIRFELMFPSCWNGKDVDSPDHKSHMAYPNLVMTGNCPEGFETRLVSLLYETIWNTYAFKGEDGRFVISNGDPTGFGYHGDFIQGWDPGFLKQAIDTCTNPSGLIEDCHLFNLQDDRTQGQCHFAIPRELEKENPFRDDDGIPGQVLIQSGPEYASHSHESPHPTETNTSLTNFSTGISYSVSSTVSTPISTLSLVHYTPGISVGDATVTTSPDEMAYLTQEKIKYEIVVVEQGVTVFVGLDGSTISTALGALSTKTTLISTSYGIVTEMAAATRLSQGQVTKRDRHQ
jgi:Domain of unknown function (DUF1996)